ncbi:MAG: hypothetical protein KBT35_05865 [Firmicutes bacterium]|nr:hypothetical protein [Candidatus Colivicinus equi]
MARCRSYENIEYKEKILDAICSNEKLVRLLTPDNINIDEDFDPTEVLPFKYLMPYDLIVGTQTEVNRYISFDVKSSRDLRNKVLKNMTITFNIICHNTLIKYNDFLAYKDRKGHYSCWWDWVICELDEMFCGERGIDLEFGIGKFEIVNNEPYFVSYAREIPFSGRTLTIVCKEFTSLDKYGK